MQEYYPLNVQENVSVVIPKMQKSIESVASCFSGAAFPTTNLQAGMLCMRTDDNNTLYQLVSTDPITWQSVGQAAVTAEKWKNPITVQLKGMATSDAVSLDGSKNIGINVTSIKATDIDDTFFANLFKRFADKAFPVGFIWESTDPTNPANILGVGTWETYGAGRVLVGAGQLSGGSNYTAGSTGGEEKHKLTTEELPRISPTISITTENASGWIDSGAEALNGNPNASSGVLSSSVNSNHRNTGGEYNNQNRINFNYSHSHTGTISSFGNNGSHENRPPYIVVYRFRRTS